MEIRQYINGSGSVEMKPEEFESIIAEAENKAYHSGRNDVNNTLAEMKDKLQELEKEKILLQVRHDQLLRATKEIALCLQYETGNGFIK